MGRCRHDHVGSMSEPVPSELSGASRLAATALTARADIQTAADGVPVVRPPHCGRSRGDARRECSRPSGRIAPSDRAVPPTPGQSGPVFFRWRQAHGTVSFRSPGSCGSPASHGVAQSAALPLARTSPDTPLLSWRSAQSKVETLHLHRAPGADGFSRRRVASTRWEPQVRISTSAGSVDVPGRPRCEQVGDEVRLSGESHRPDPGPR